MQLNATRVYIWWLRKILISCVNSAGSNKKCSTIYQKNNHLQGVFFFLIFSNFPRNCWPGCTWDLTRRRFIFSNIFWETLFIVVCFKGEIVALEFHWIVPLKLSYRCVWPQDGHLCPFWFTKSPGKTFSLLPAALMTTLFFSSFNVCHFLSHL